MSQLIGNLICYPNPYPQLHTYLPPPRQQIEEVLAIVFTGSVRPTDQDKERVPLLVRRNIVKNALEWLKLNHQDYDDIHISERNLNTYTNEVMPFYYTFIQRDENNPIESRAANDNYSSRGVEDGPCPFTVHGVAYDDLIPFHRETLKAISLNHMLNGGKALAIPHNTLPESLYSHGYFPTAVVASVTQKLSAICLNTHTRNT
ncbi:hypothetical protein EXIGLDRAFT_712984 [Exidia glandulosa HHB12029]|uniref:DUF6570 domain-containing protein n=1 Tax=Exidia glandulosa HHB12029 TaxID=1314781 RepID=A0A165LXK6_EXIGL|nr:hypothetical protein EXIGLDRAFT_712984 [Exidia glandulosa HHB12029]